MERAVKNLLGIKYGHGHGEDRMLADEEETRHSCKAFVCAVSSSHVEGDPTKSLTWSVAKDRSPNCKIWEAAEQRVQPLVSFKASSLKRMGLMKKAKSEFAQTRPVACILSIGAGIPKALGFTRPKSLTEKVAPMSLVNVLKGTATSTEKEAAEMEKKFANVPGVYDRIKVGRDIGDIGLEKLEELGQVKSHTRAYLRKDGISRQIDGIVAASRLSREFNYISLVIKPWLLVFDNFDDPADYEITKYLPQSNFGLIIVTGRHPAANDLDYPTPIDNLLEEEAMNLLFHRTKKERTHANVEDARKICCHLSCLALAADQAGAYIKSTGIGLSLFIEHFDKQQENIMAWSLPLKNYKRLDPAAPDQEITLTVSTAWELSYNRISGSKEIVEAKRHFLLISAYFGDNCVDEYVFRQFFETNSERLSWINMFQDQETHKWDSSAFLAVVTELRDLSLFRSNSVLLQGAVYSFHPMTRKWALYRQSRTEKQHLALEAMDILINSNFDTPADENLVNPPTGKKPHSLPHTESCFLSCEEFVSESQAIGISGPRKIGYTLAGIFLRHGHWGRSELIFKRLRLCPMKDAPKIWIYSLCGLSVVLKESFQKRDTKC
ncbi:hypothetical protein EAF00_009591 [Botryotinia globosa]|nr:hypothetical protein EAF00_009591 [Botryotinia globosa]